MKPFLADWKNPALLGAGIIIVILLLMVISLNGQSMNKAVASVGGSAITNKDVLEEARSAQGDNLLLNLIGNRLIDKYADMQKVTVSNDEIEQVLRFERMSAKVNGLSFEDFLKEQGTSLEKRRRDIATEIKQMRLVVPEAEIKKNFAGFMNNEQNYMRLYIPASYEYHRYLVADEKSAKDIVDMLKQGKKEEAAGNTQMPEDAQKSHVFLVGVQNDLPALEPALKKMKPGEMSKPFAIQLAKNVKGWAVITLDSSTPELKPTYENSYVPVALSLARSDAYAKARNDLESKAMAKIEASVIDIKAFPHAAEVLQQMYQQNLMVPDAPANIPGVPGGATGNGPAPQSMPMPVTTPSTGK